MRLRNKKELSQYLNCSIGSIDKMMKENKIRYIKIGKLVRFDIDEVNKDLGISSKEEVDSVMKKIVIDG
jgi:excisionase family DNA binding protein